MGSMFNIPAQIPSITMEAANAKVTFPGFQQVFDIQDKEIEIRNTDKKIRGYILQAYGALPGGGISKDLIKYALTYIMSYAENDKDPVDRKIEKHIGTFLYSQLSAEFNEIKKKLESIESFITENRFNEAYIDINYCIARCGVLLDLFLNNLQHALGMAILFKELCLVYIVLGMILVKYDKMHKTNIITRFNEIENAVNKFKESVINERMKMFRVTIFEGCSYRDLLRDDMRVLSINLPEFVTPGIEREAQRRQKQYEEYRDRLRSLYNDYFDRIKCDALDLAKTEL